MADNFKEIYPLPNNVRAEPSTTIGEVRQPRAPSVFLELGYHDNEDDATWIKNNLESSARVIALTLTEFFGLPFLTPRAYKSAVVDVDWGNLNIRDKPSTDSYVVTRAPDGAPLTVINQYRDWYVVRYRGIVGWANSDFVTLV